MQNPIHNYKDIRAISQLLKQAQTMIDKYDLPAQPFLEKLGFLETQPETEITFGRSGGRFHLFKTLEEAKERIIIKCPWVSNHSIDNDLMLRLNYALEQGIQIDLGWGYQYDIGTNIKQDHHGNLIFTPSAQTGYSAIPKLFQLQKRYSDRFHLKLTGGHSKFFICDRKFAYVGSHNVLSSNILKPSTSYPDLQGDETGTIHRGLEAIQKLITRYDQAPDRTIDMRLSA